MKPVHLLSSVSSNLQHNHSNGLREYDNGKACSSRYFREDRVKDGQTTNQEDYKKIKLQVKGLLRCVMSVIGPFFKKKNLTPQYWVKLSLYYYVKFMPVFSLIFFWDQSLLCIKVLFKSRHYQNLWFQPFLLAFESSNFY